MSLSIELRPVQTDDEELLFEIYADTRREELTAWGWDASQQGMFLRMQFHAQRMHFAGQGAAVEESIVLLDGVPVGHLAVRREEEAMRLVNIAILTPYRNRGIGTVLIGALIEEARRQGRKLQLQVTLTNPAHNLYNRLGFVVIDQDNLHRHMEWRPDSVPQ